MTVHDDRLEFCGVGFHRWELRRYEISRERVETILARWTTGTPWFLPKFVSRRYGIRVVSKPGGAFGDRDEYRFTFDLAPVCRARRVWGQAPWPGGAVHFRLAHPARSLRQHLGRGDHFLHPAWWIAGLRRRNEICRRWR
jgi:hypothetical protein